MGVWIMGILGVLFLALGVFMKRSQGTAKTAAGLMFRSAVYFVLLAAAIHWKIDWASVALIFILVADSCITPVFIIRKTPQSLYRKGVTAAIIITTAVVFVSIGAIFFYGEQEPTVLVSGDSVQIKAMYGLTVPFLDITGLSLMDKSMGEIGAGRRTNGYAGFGDTLKGHFSSDSLGSCLLFVSADSSPTLLIERSGGENVYLSFKESEKTQALYEELEKQLAQHQ